jgi:hypothetical protein
VWPPTSSALPFDPVATPDPEPPPAYSRWDTFDFVRVIAAHRRINRFRLAALRTLIPDAPKGDRARCSPFFATVSDKHDKPPRHYTLDRSLCSLLAARALSAAAEREAVERAKREATTLR